MFIIVFKYCIRLDPNGILLKLIIICDYVELTHKL